MFDRTFDERFDGLIDRSLSGVLDGSFDAIGCSMAQDAPWTNAFSSIMSNASGMSLS